MCLKLVSEMSTVIFVLVPVQALQVLDTLVIQGTDTLDVKDKAAVSIWENIT